MHICAVFGLLSRICPDLPIFTAVCLHIGGQKLSVYTKKIADGRGSALYPAAELTTLPQIGPLTARASVALAPHNSRLERSSRIAVAKLWSHYFIGRRKLQAIPGSMLTDGHFRINVKKRSFVLDHRSLLPELTRINSGRICINLGNALSRKWSRLGGHRTRQPRPPVSDAVSPPTTSRPTLGRRSSSPRRLATVASAFTIRRRRSTLESARRRRQEQVGLATGGGVKGQLATGHSLLVHSACHCSDCRLKAGRKSKGCSKHETKKCSCP